MRTRKPCKVATTEGINWRGRRVRVYWNGSIAFGVVVTHTGRDRWAIDLEAGARIIAHRSTFTAIPGL